MSENCSDISTVQRSRNYAAVSFWGLRRVWQRKKTATPIKLKKKQNRVLQTGFETLSSHLTRLRTQGLAL